MDVTIIGAGNMARGIATRAIAAGKSVELVHPDPDKASALAAQLAETAGEKAVDENVVGTAALGSSITGGIVVLAVPYEAVPDMIHAIGDGLSGKVVVDICNPVEWPALDRVLTPPGTSAAGSFFRRFFVPTLTSWASPPYDECQVSSYRSLPSESYTLRRTVVAVGGVPA